MTFNRLDFLIFIASIGADYGILRLLGFGEDDEGVWMMIAGPLIAVLDIAYRLGAGLRLREATKGPSILWLPAWPWGLFWCGLGAYYYWQQT